eukprot:TRINITY_DN3623_c0_g1_i1.p1 TRINITY_DN3623_c0_g1~~TRINITY_DN3623_c0_g1_i1.p1  ORF type:complete len:1456 (+),score=244.72 TRINITY_DN3623_c0_g1_i1:196-4563(+)
MWVFRPVREPITRSPRSSSLIVGRPMGKPWVMSEENEFFILQSQTGTSAWRIVMKGSEDYKNKGTPPKRTSPPLQSGPLRSSPAITRRPSGGPVEDGADVRTDAHLVTEASSWQETMAKWEWLKANVLVICSFFDRSSPKEERELWNFLILKLKNLADEAKEEYKQKINNAQKSDSTAQDDSMETSSPDEDRLLRLRSSAASAPPICRTSRPSTPVMDRKQFHLNLPVKTMSDDDDEDNKTPESRPLSADRVTSDGEVTIFSDHEGDYHSDSDSASSNDSESELYISRKPKKKYSGSSIGGGVSMAVVKGQGSGNPISARASLNGRTSICSSGNSGGGHKKKTRAEIARLRKNSQSRSRDDQDDDAMPSPPPVPSYKATDVWAASFPHLPLDHIISMYRCTLSRNGQRKGRVFASLTRIYFCAKRYHTRIVIPWNEVAFLRPSISAVEEESDPSELNPDPKYVIRIVTIHDEEFLFLNFCDYEEMLILFVELRRQAINRLNEKVTAATSQHRHKRRRLTYDPFEKIAKEVMFTRVNADMVRKSFRLPKQEQLLNEFDATLRDGLFTHQGSLFVFTNFLCFRSASIISPTLVAVYLGDIVKLSMVRDDSIVRVQTHHYKFNFVVNSKMCREVHEAISATVDMFKETEHPSSPRKLNSTLDGSRRYIGLGPVLRDETQFRHDYMSRQLKQKKLWDQYITKFGGGVELMQTERMGALILDGISDDLRGPVWQTLLGSIYHLRETSEEYHQILSERKGQQSTATIDIKKDIHRSLHHPYFEMDEGRNALQRVLIAYSWRNPQVGYCQSMNILTALLLLFMTEEEAYSALGRICEELLPQYFTPDMIGAVTDQHVFEDLIEEYFPTMYKHLQTMNFPFALLSFPWFLCIFVGHLPMEATLRVWDRLFYEGGLFSDTTFLFKMGLALLKQNELTVLTQGEGCDVASVLKKCNYNIDLLMQEAASFESVTIDKVQELRYFHKLHMLKEMQSAPVLCVSPTDNHSAQSEALHASTPNAHNRATSMDVDEQPEITSEKARRKEARKQKRHSRKKSLRGSATLSVISETGEWHEQSPKPEATTMGGKEESALLPHVPENAAVAHRTPEKQNLRKSLLGIIGDWQAEANVALKRLSVTSPLAMQLEEEGRRMAEEEAASQKKHEDAVHTGYTESPTKVGAAASNAEARAAAAAKRLSLAIGARTPLNRETSIGEFAVMRLLRGGADAHSEAPTADQSDGAAGGSAEPLSAHSKGSALALSARTRSHRRVRSNVVVTEAVSESAHLINQAAQEAAMSPRHPPTLSNESLRAAENKSRIQWLSAHSLGPEQVSTKPETQNFLKRRSKSPRKLKSPRDKESELEKSSHAIKVNGSTTEDEPTVVAQTRKSPSVRRKDSDSAKEREKKREKEKEKEKELEKQKEREKELEKQREREAELEKEKELALKKKSSGGVTFISRWRRKVAGGAD